MKKSLVILCTMLLSFGLVIDARATLIDFESTPKGDYTSLSFGDFTLTSEDGSQFSVFDSPVSEGYIEGHRINMSKLHPNSLVKFKGSFSVPDVYYFDIGVGDNGADEDHAYLEAYDASWTLLASADYQYQNPAKDVFDGGYLSVTTADPIAYVLFWSKGTPDNTAYWDNITYETREGSSNPNQDPDPDPNSVPEPATMLLLGAGLVGLVGASRSKFLK